MEHKRIPFASGFKRSLNGIAPGLEELRLGGSRAALDRLARGAAKLTGCRYVFIYAVAEGELALLSSFGLNSFIERNFDTPSLARLNLGQHDLEIHDLARHPLFKDAPLVHGPAQWRYMVNASINLVVPNESEGFISIICIDDKPRQKSASNLNMLTGYARIIEDMMNLMLSAENSNPIQYSYDLPSFPAKIQHVNDIALPLSRAASEPASIFLNETLIRRERLLNRNGQNYLALRTWAKPVKKYQISALKALKLNPPHGFIDYIADEMECAIRRVHGNAANAVVIPVPCGHSGSGCLSAQIAYALAAKMGLACCEAFECQHQNGSSHPKTNSKRPPMRLIKEPPQIAILVDDVATSGAHIEEASRLLGASADSVWPVVWIAG